MGTEEVEVEVEGGEEGGTFKRRWAFTVARFV